MAANTAIAIANTQVSGLGTMSTQNANAVAITGGSASGIALTLGANLDTNGYSVIGGNFGGNQLVLPAGFGPTLQGLYEGNAFIKTSTTGSVNRTWTFLDSDGSFTSPGPINGTVGTFTDLTFTGALTGTISGGTYA